MAINSKSSHVCYYHQHPHHFCLYHNRHFAGYYLHCTVHVISNRLFKVGNFLTTVNLIPETSLVLFRLVAYFHAESCLNFICCTKDDAKWRSSAQHLVVVFGSQRGDCSIPFRVPRRHFDQVSRLQIDAPVVKWSVVAKLNGHLTFANVTVDLVWNDPWAGD